MITSNADEMSINVQQFLQDSRKLIGKLYRGKKTYFFSSLLIFFNPRAYLNGGQLKIHACRTIIYT